MKIIQHLVTTLALLSISLSFIAYVVADAPPEPYITLTEGEANLIEHYTLKGHTQSQISFIIPKRKENHELIVKLMAPMTDIHKISLTNPYNESTYLHPDFIRTNSDSLHTYEKDNTYYFNETGNLIAGKWTITITHKPAAKMELVETTAFLTPQYSINLYSSSTSITLGKSILFSIFPEEYGTPLTEKHLSIAVYKDGKQMKQPLDAVEFSSLDNQAGKYMAVFEPPEKGEYLFKAYSKDIPTCSEQETIVTVK